MSVPQPTAKASGRLHAGSRRAVGRGLVLVAVVLGLAAGGYFAVGRYAVWREARRVRAALAARFPGERLVIPTGGYKTRSNDTEYRFRPGTEFAHLVGSHEPDAVLVVESGRSVLYQAPVMDRSTPAFFTDRVYGELWAAALASCSLVHSIAALST